MFSTYRIFSKYSSNIIGARFASVVSLRQNKFVIFNKKHELQNNVSFSANLGGENNLFKAVNYQLYSPLEVKRHFSKKKKGSKRTVEQEEESDSDEEEDIEDDASGDDLGINTVTRQVTSLRLDGILKAGLSSLTKKKIEQEFYALKLRVNGVQAVKKSMNVYVGDELDRVKGFSPETSKHLIVDRVIIKRVGKLTNNDKYPVDLEVLKDLTVENYEDPWCPTNVKKLED